MPEVPGVSRIELAKQFRGTLSDIGSASPQGAAEADDLDLAAMARAALNYLRGNPDPQRNYECKWSLGPLGIPCHVLLMPPRSDAYDLISLSDTDCRMDWQYPHMRQMAGEPKADAVEEGVRRRIRGYQRSDHLTWVNPAAFTGPDAGLAEEWASTWGSAKLLYSLAETYERTGDKTLAAEAREILIALKKIASWDGPRAFYPAGPAPWKDGQWLTEPGWCSIHSRNYPFVVEPFIRYWECTGDEEGLELAKAFTEGFLADSQPGMGELRIDAKTGAFQNHVHLHTHAIWGVAHLGAVLHEPRYLQWAGRAYDFVVANGTDYGWSPEFLPQPEYRSEVCTVGDMVSTAVWLARGGRPDVWDYVERTIRNTIRRSQFFLTPAFLELFHRLHKDKPREEVARAIAELRRLEGGFVAQTGFDDWVCYFASIGKAGLCENGVQMMGCCPPEGMRALWEAWNGVVETRPEGVFINMTLGRDHPAARVRAFRPQDGRMDVEAKRPGAYFLRPPGWADRASVRLMRRGKATPTQWGGPDGAYVAAADVAAGERISLAWAVPRFTQTFVPTSVPGRSDSVSVRWVGNEVIGVEPRGKYLPMFEAK